MKKEFSLEEDVINLEWAAKNEKQPPKGKKYQYKVDDAELISETETLTGKEILERAGKIPAGNFILRQKIKGNWITIKLNDSVDFTEPGVEKFKTLPNDQTEGENSVKSLKRDFTLLEEDAEFLNSLKLPWEAVNISNTNWVFVHDYSVVDGYNICKATIGFRIVGGYPTAQLDMVYFHPKLARRDGQPILAISDLQLQGKIFQQWSRHRTAANPWRPGIDNLSTHYPLVEAWLLKEFEKRPYYAKTA
ncbi:multiubiquitin domain-containing protein [Fulvivirgaceae bacterium PWU4]|uniref:Multiubiquitin domain-containing protein n=1 Tax=Chryseosolibacter histidini TaxID=2782349 RepID=A0AAP2DIS7_9BACT|nr:multiubiquitin domain-containing protein [Chryseosolibacter histidini]MBT1697143.1 multiubiquitin domain-containing protein [Chryseosolibacter histidini]